MGRRSPFGKNKRLSTMDAGALVDVDGEEGVGEWKNMSEEVEDEEDSWNLAGNFHDHGHGMKTSLALDFHGIA